MSQTDLIVFNSAFKGQVQRLLAGGSVHAVLVCAPAGCGGDDAARLVAADYIGTRPEYVASHTHPDCIEVSGSGLSGQIKAAELRFALCEIAKGAALGTRRAVIIYHGEDLNASSSAILLKTLEEPPQNVLFLITANSRDALTETVVSRCASVYLSPLNAGEAREYIRLKHPDAPSDAVKTALAAFGGRVEYIDAALADKARLAAADAALRLCGAAIRGDRFYVLSALSGEKAEVFALLDDALCCLENSVAEGSPRAAQVLCGVLRLIGDIKSNTPVNISAANFCANL